MATPRHAVERPAAQTRPARRARRLTAGDVLVLMSPAYWLMPPWGLFLALRQAAITAFMALAHVGAFGITRLLLADWRPGNTDFVTVRWRGETELVPVLPELKAAVESYLALRPATGCPYLFVTRTGTALDYNVISRTFRRAGRFASRRRPLTRLLLAFCATAVGKDGDTRAVNWFLRHSVSPGRRPPAVSRDRLRRLLLRTNPLKGLGRALHRPEHLAQAVRKHGMTMPNSCRPKPPRGEPAAFMAPGEHPAVAALSEVAWPRGRSARMALRKDLYARHGAEIAGLVGTGRMPRIQAAALFALDERSYQTKARRAAMSPDERAARPSARTRRRAERRAEAARSRMLSPEERQLVYMLAAFPWSKSLAERNVQRRDLVSRHFTAVSRLAGRGKLSGQEAAALFRMCENVMSQLRVRERRGLPSGLDALVEKDRERRRWRDMVSRAAAVRPEGDTIAALHGRLREQGYPYGAEAVRTCIVGRRRYR